MRHAGSRPAKRRSPRCCASAKPVSGRDAMPAFRYEALDAEGRSRYGSIDALTPRAARDALRASGLAPVDVAEAAAVAAGQGAAWHRGLSPDDTSLVTRQLATLLVAGSPLEQALAAV